MYEISKIELQYCTAFLDMFKGPVYCGRRLGSCSRRMCSALVPLKCALLPLYVEYALAAVSVSL